MFYIFILVFNFVFIINGINVTFLRNDGNTTIACTTAIEHAKSSGQCQDDIYLKIGDACRIGNDALGTVAACDFFYNENAKAIVGPECFDESSHLALLSYHWKIPLFSPNGKVVYNYNNTVFPTVIHTSFSNVVLYANSLMLFMNRFNLSSVTFLGPKDDRNIHFRSIFEGVNKYFKTYFYNITTNIISIEESRLSSYNPKDIGLISFIKLIVIDTSFNDLHSVLQQMEVSSLYDHGYIFILLCSQHSSVCDSNIDKIILDCNMLLLGPYFKNYTDIDLLMSQYFKDSYNRFKGINYLSTYISCYSSCVASKLNTNLDGTSVVNTMKGKQLNTSLGNFIFDQMPSILITQSFSQYDSVNNTFVDLILTNPIASTCSKNKCFNLVC